MCKERYLMIFKEMLTDLTEVMRNIIKACVPLQFVGAISF